jgi:hypothetical protein
MLRDYLSISALRALDCLSLNNLLMCCPETSVNIKQCNPRKIPEEEGLYAKYISK